MNVQSGLGIWNNLSIIWGKFTQAVSKVYSRFTQTRASKMLLKFLIIKKISRFYEQYQIKMPHFIMVCDID